MLSKIKEFANDIRIFNKKYKCAPLIVFAITYAASPADFAPEFITESWLLYLDDMAALIFAFVITYTEVFLNETIHSDNENDKGVYSAVRRNSVGLGGRRDTDGAGHTGGDDIHGILADQFAQPGERSADSGANGEPAASAEPELFGAEPADPGQPPDDSGAGFYERHFICEPSESNDCAREISEQCRPESFIIDDGNAIIW